MATTHVEKVHAKGLMVDEKQVFVGSINWSENSFKGNREVGVVLRSKEATGYYRELFVEDWRNSRLYRVSIDKSGVSVVDRPAKRARRLRRAQ